MKCSDCNLPIEGGGEGNWLQISKYKHFKRVCVACYMKSTRYEPEDNLQHPQE